MSKRKPFDARTDWTLDGKPVPDWRKTAAADNGDDNEDPEPIDPKLSRGILGFDTDDLFNSDGSVKSSIKS